MCVTVEFVVVWGREQQIWLFVWQRPCQVDKLRSIGPLLAPVALGF